MTEENVVQLPAFYGKKAGMTRIFDANGNHVPVTVIQLISNYISQVKTQEKNGYEAYQLAYYPKREKLLNKPTKGHLKKAAIDELLTRFAEVRTSDVSADALGKQVSFADFKPATFVDVTGISKGKGFQGVVKRHGFQIGHMTHGSHLHRTGGSIGNCATPGRVYPMKKMPGQMGNKQRTAQNLQIVELNLDKGYLLIKGSVPGSKNSYVRVSKAQKK